MGVFEGTVCDASQRCCTGSRGRGLWAGPCSPDRPQLPVHCQDGQPRLSPFVCLQLTADARTWPALGLLLASAPVDGCPTGVRTTLTACQSRLCSPSSVSQSWVTGFGRSVWWNSCSPPLLCRSFCGSQGVGPAAASEQRLSLPRWDCNACSARLLPDWNTAASQLNLWNVLGFFSLLFWVRSRQKNISRKQASLVLPALVSKCILGISQWAVYKHVVTGEKC